MTHSHSHTRATDRAHLATEQRLAASSELDAASVEQTLQLMNDQDAQVPAVVREALPAIAQLARAVAAALERGGRLIYLGAGTSGRLGVLDAAECPPTFHSEPWQVVGLIAGGDQALREAVEGAEDDERGAHEALDKLDVNKSDVVVGIAAGGTTPYVWGALAHARQRNAITGLVTCVALDQLTQQTPRTVIDHSIELPVGPEIVTGSTRLKAGTATKLTLNMITTAAFSQLGKTWGNLMVDLRVTNTKLRDRALRILCSQTALSTEQATTVLDQARGRVKLALVMAKLELDADEAQQRLDETHGRLRPLLGAPR